MHLLSRLSGRSTHVLVAFIVFSLSSGVLGGVIFYIDSVGPEVMQDFTQNVDIDMQVHVSSTIHDQDNFTLGNITDIIQQQEGVLAVEPVFMLQYDDTEWEANVIFGVNESLFNRFPNAIWTNSTQFPVVNHTCLAQTQRMVELGLKSKLHNDWNL